MAYSMYTEATVFTTFMLYLLAQKDLKIGYVIFTNSNTADVLLENLHKLLIEGKDAKQ